MSPHGFPDLLLSLFEQLVEQLRVKVVDWQMHPSHAKVLSNQQLGQRILVIEFDPGVALASAWAAAPARAEQRIMPSSKPRSRTPARSSPTASLLSSPSPGRTATRTLIDRAPATACRRNRQPVAALDDLRANHAHPFEEQPHQKLERSRW